MADINEHILEIRYKPITQILDHRGSWAQEIISQMGLEAFHITENRIDIFNKNNKERCFLGFQNAGMVIHDAPSGNYFFKRTKKFIEYIFSKEDIKKELLVNRIGIRIKKCKEYKGKYEEIKDKYFGCKPSYFFTTLNYKGKTCNYNTKSGPVNDDHLKTLFDRNTGFPKVGLYLDIDCWLKPKDGTNNEKNFLEIVLNLINDNSKKREDIFSLVLNS